MRKSVCFSPFPWNYLSTDFGSFCPPPFSPANLDWPAVKWFICLMWFVSTHLKHQECAAIKAKLYRQTRCKKPTCPASFLGIKITGIPIAKLLWKMIWCLLSYFLTLKITSLFNTLSPLSNISFFILLRTHISTIITISILCRFFKRQSTDKNISSPTKPHNQ